MNAVVIPMKQLNLSKQRLNPFLSGEKKNRFVALMFEDVIEELKKCHLVNKIFVVTSDPFIQRIAKHYQISIIDDNGITDLNSAVNLGYSEAQLMGYKNIVVLPGDIPLVQAQDIDRMFSDRTDATIVSSRTGCGTNAFRLTKQVDFQYGEDSYLKHLKELKIKKMTYKERAFPGIGFDIDYPQDVIELDFRSPVKKSSKYLLESGIVTSKYSGRKDYFLTEVVK